MSKQTKHFDYKIRAGEPSDIQAIVQLSAQLAEYEQFSSQFKMNEKAFEKYCFCTNPLFYTVVAEIAETVNEAQESKGQLAAMALYFYAFSSFTGKPTLYIEDIFVLDEFRGQGIGKNLFDELIKTAKAKDCARIEWAVLNWNQPSIDFYKSLGAKPLDDRSTYRLDLL